MDSNPEFLPTYEKNPFLGPIPLRRGDPIFGRERELKVLLNQVLSDRLVLLHSSSGCGKTSLVEAGLKEELKRKFRIYPSVSLKLTEDDESPENTLSARLERSLAAAPESSPQLEPRHPEFNGPDTKKAANDRDFFFFDQFEEVLADKQMDEAKRVEFFKELGLALESTKRWALFAIREDYLGDLQPYVRFLPNQLGSRFRLTQLTVADAVSAIRMQQKPSPTIPARTAFSLSAAMELANNLAKTTSFRESSVIVEPVHLQVVCQYLWEQIQEHPIQAIPLKDGSSTSTVSAALAGYYEKVIAGLAGVDKVNEYRIRKWFDDDLIDTIRGQRLRVRVPAGSKRISAAELDYLKNQYLIRDDQPSAPTDDRVVELAHDRLIAPITDANKLYFTPFGQAWLKTAQKYQADPQTILLLKGDALREAEAWVAAQPEKVGDDAKNFLKASREHQRRNTLLGMLTTIAIMSMAVALLAVAFAYLSVKELREKKREADEASQKALKSAADSAQYARSVTAYANLRAIQIGKAEMMARETIREAHVAVRAAHERELGAERVANEAKERSHVFALAADQAGEAKRKADDAVTTQRELANQYQANSDSIQALSSAKEKQSLDKALESLRISTKAGNPAQLAGDDQRNLVERAAEMTRSLLSRSLLKRTLCLGGYIQSFGVINGTGRLVAVGEDGKLYDEHSIQDCPQDGSAPKISARRDRALNTPNVSAIATHSDAVAGGNFRGKIEFFRDGLYLPDAMKMHQQVIALTLTSDGHFLGAASSFWSVGVWRIKKDVASRVLHWPGNRWNPVAWIRWIWLFGSTGNQRTNALALYVDETLPKGASQGYLAEARDDGCLAVVPVRIDTKRVTRPEVQARCNGSSPLTALALSEDGKLLMTGAKDGKVNVWWMGGQQGNWNNINKVPNVPLTESDDNTSCKSRVTSLAFLDKDSEMAAVGCPDGTIHLYDTSKLRDAFGATSSFELLAVLKGGLGSVAGLSFDTGSRLLYATGASTKVEVWDIPSAAGFRARATLDQEVKDIESAAKTTAPDKLAPKIKKLIRDVCSASAAAASFDQCSGEVTPRK